MAEFNNLVTTAVGQELFTDILANEDKLEFTKIVTSSNIYPANQLTDLEVLTNTKQEILISNITKQDETKIKLEAVIENKELTEGYIVNTIGIYAKGTNTEEMLYAVTSVSSDGKGSYIPPYNNLTVAGIALDVMVAVTDSSSVSFDINPQAGVTEARLQEVKKGLEKYVDESSADITWNDFADNQYILKLYKGTTANINIVPIQGGQLLVCTDSGKIYLDINDTQRILIGGSEIPINPTDTTGLNLWIEDR